MELRVISKFLASKPTGWFVIHLCVSYAYLGLPPGHLMASPELKQQTYRITNLPITCTKQQIKNVFPASEKKLIEGVSLAPNHLDDDHPSQTATITFASKPASLENLNFTTGGRLEDLVEVADHRFATVRIDSNFYGWTPLFADVNVSDDNLVDIVAVTGLAGKAFASWQCDDGSMWLRDHLPIDIPGIRVSIFGYSSELSRSNSRAVLNDFTDDFLPDSSYSHWS
ncbi:hypothetical protein M426DRAFT_26735 [Hypoxylon sp. CI-4A]|nr:hypothetical protein M426DRAFT_26735 [Hypoxylon sp. CI-4A]